MIDYSKYTGFSYEELLISLCDNYSSVFLIDFDEDKVYPYRLNPFIRDLFGDFFKTIPTYDEAVKIYIDSVVFKKDRYDAERLVSKEAIMSRLRNERSISFDYREYLDGREKFFTVKLCNVDGKGDVHHVAVGFQDITALMKYSNVYYTEKDTVLIVEDDEIDRGVLKNIMERDHDVLVASSGKEALELLEEHFEDISIVLADLVMPEINGVELLQKMNLDKRFNSIPIMIITAHGTPDIEINCLRLGASDFISKPYNPEVIRCKVQCAKRIRENVSQLNTNEKDALTGLYMKDFFYKYAEEILEKDSSGEYVIAVSDIENFKTINDNYGFEDGNRLLKYLADNGAKKMPGFVIGGRIGSDVFVALLRSSIHSGMEKTMENEILANAPVPGINVKYGFYHVERGDSVRVMCDRALIALRQVKGKYGEDVAVYDDSMRTELLRQHHILGSMEDAIKHHEFEVYFQGKHDLRKNTIGGAEALVRWNHPTMGFLNPGEFIPLFERNGFITKLDTYILEDVCRILSEWKKEGIPLVPISVNLSRKDFESGDLAKKITRIVDSYKVEHSLIHLEITESAYTDNPKLISKTVNKLHDLGFVLELDDFGSGYSSLTALNDLHLDILKLDRSIVSTDVPGSDKNILEFSVQLCKMLGLKTVAEGVETSDQVKRMIALDCDYIQGYYFFKPVQREKFEFFLKTQPNS